MASRKIKKRKIFYIFIGLLLLVSIFLNTYLLLKYHVLPPKYLGIYAVVVGLLPILMIMYTLFKKRKSKVKGIIAVIEMIYIIVLFFVFSYLNSTFNFLDKFTTNIGYETKQYIVLVLKDSGYKDIKELKGKTIGYTNGLDNSLENALKELDKKIQYEKKESDGYGELFSNLDEGNIEGLLINQAYLDTLIENDEEDTYSKYYELYRFHVKEKVEEVIKDVDVTNEPFIVYITGMDTFGGITDQNRSDVNIIMSVNPKTNKIVLVNIPRDYYVELVGEGNGEKDKLTHAGMYGVNVSIKTIEKLLDIDINYYIKLNYNALIQLVDALGGVDVESAYDFTSGYYYVHYKKGINHVDGKGALDFVRTRKAFTQGDRVRGENQQRMIQAIFKKVSSPSILIKYDDILKSLEGNFVTNASTNTIMSLINMQLDKMPTWVFSTYSLNGGDGLEKTHSFKDPLYVMLPNEESVNEGIRVLKENRE